MYTHLLVPTDGSKLSDKAIAHAIDLARLTNGMLTFLHATSEYPAPIYAEGVGASPKFRKEYADQARADAKRVLDRATAKAAKAKVACRSIHAVTSKPWRAILDAAKEQKCDAIVMASHGRRGLSAFLLGSETTKVLTYGKLPVLVVR